MDSESQSLAEPRSELKVLAGQKRGISEVGKSSESSDKRVKLLDHESVICSQTQAEKGISSCYLEENSNSLTFDENVDAVNYKEEMERRTALGKSKEIDLDLNAEEPLCPGKNHEILKSRDDSECESSISPLDEQESMRVWKGLKQNNFMSNPHGTITVPTAIPKPRARKKINNDLTKKKTELAKKEQVDRFARVAAPSGLLNGLNPGIINHVRNSKQVHSIIEALVKSERAEIEKQRRGKNQVDQAKNGTRFGHGEGLRGKRQLGDYNFFSRSVTLNNGISKGNGDPYVAENGYFSGAASQYSVEKENDRLTLKLSSSENASCLTNEESGNYSSVNSLPVQAANVASQWLELQTQDIKGRLAALRRSKDRVQAVITTELPFLISTEFSNSSKATVDAHSLKWNTLFGQMENTLSEEEHHLESWLNQVMEMQLHCEKGLYKSNLYNNVPQLMGSTGNKRLGEVDNAENDLAVRAAAASIYSTCNFLLSVENPPCGI